MMAEHWHKRQALCLAGQLPDNASDANAVICELQNLVDTWLHVAEPAPPSKVVSLALQLPFCFEVRTLSDRLVSSAPE